MARVQGLISAGWVGRDRTHLSFTSFRAKNAATQGSITQIRANRAVRKDTGISTSIPKKKDYPRPAPSDVARGQTGSHIGLEGIQNKE